VSRTQRQVLALESVAALMVALVLAV